MLGQDFRNLKVGGEEFELFGILGEEFHQFLAILFTQVAVDEVGKQILDVCGLWGVHGLIDWMVLV